VSKRAWRPRLLNAPNTVTLARLGALPFILWLSYATDRTGILCAALLFSLAAAADGLDGYLARRLDAATRLGTLLDPVVDKATVLSILMVFADRGLLPVAIVILLMVREFLITALRHGLSTRDHALGANWMGKTKYSLQVTLIEMVYVQLLLEARMGRLPVARTVILWAAIALTVLSYAFLANFVRWHWTELQTGPTPDG